ncbi:Hypothetical protein NTJ_11482 [Nesidiocoris tenuis]|uniref:Uncharacterized protein n=1 Tax=Nesidiocoris tenuis TaxID=355587 RepID=A0ABN7B2N7_9HEMI|nr:Hypothetical protein NTJ_11482 [Nesidiocoris tenuis]
MGASQWRRNARIPATIKCARAWEAILSTFTAFWLFGKENFLQYKPPLSYEEYEEGKISKDIMKPNLLKLLEIPQIFKRRSQKTVDG